MPRESTRGVDQIKNEVFEEIVEVGTIDNAYKSPGTDNKRINPLKK